MWLTLDDTQHPLIHSFHIAYDMSTMSVWRRCTLRWEQGDEKERPGLGPNRNFSLGEEVNIKLILVTNLFKLQ